VIHSINNLLDNNSTSLYRRRCHDHPTKSGDHDRRQPCYGGQRGVVRAREAALLTERSHDGESEGSIERAKASVQ